MAPTTLVLVLLQAPTSLVLLLITSLSAQMATRLRHLLQINLIFPISSTVPTMQVVALPTRQGKSALVAPAHLLASQYKPTTAIPTQHSSPLAPLPPRRQQHSSLYQTLASLPLPISRFQRSAPEQAIVSP